MKCADSFWYHINYKSRFEILSTWDFMSKNNISRVKQGNGCIFLERCSENLEKSEFLEIEVTEKVSSDISVDNYFLPLC